MLIPYFLLAMPPVLWFWWCRHCENEGYGFPGDA